MLIVCPSCAKSYHIARASLGAEGRTVQCSRCFSRWQCQTPRESAYDVALASGPEASLSLVNEAATVLAGQVVSGHKHDDYAERYGAPRARLRRMPPPTSQSRAPIFQAAAAGLVIAAAMGGVAARQAIVTRMPSLAIVYASIGLPVNPRGISFTEVRSALAQDGAAQVLSIEGKLTNLRQTTVKVPEIVTALKGPDGRDVYTWTSPAPKATLGPGEIAAFRTRLATPPANARDVVLRFASVDDARATRGTPLHETKPQN